ncbi:MAG: IclR family transcriptional regulator [Chloroflexi bacterium]|nr:IclR family transcriptional regulator [Chloroflexota bacterium]
MNQTTMPPVRALQRGLDVLFAIVDAGEAVGLGELARRTQLHKATVSRLLGTLVDGGYVSHNLVHGTYGIGAEAARRLLHGSVESELQHLAGLVLGELRDLSGETAGLFIPTWPDRICIDQAESRSGLRRIFVLGERSPLTHGSTGRSYLAHVSEAEVRAVLRLRPLAAPTAQAPYDEAWFLADLARIRANGFGLSDYEGIVGMCAMGAPVCGADNRPVAMLAISGPSGRWTTDARLDFAPTLVRAAARLSEVARNRPSLAVQG